MPTEDAVGRLLRSPAFTRSRRAALVLQDDPVALAELLDLVRLQQIDDGARLSDAAPLVRSAVSWLEAAVEEGDLGRQGHLARRRLVIAALHYVVSVTDVIPDNAPGGTVDDVLVVRTVLGGVLSDA
ncbi:DUF1232 domain-containing protein [Luteipulveratus sp. YIM 133132]|uniref:DUF1232 domain-containing protein n=1 Tax=Luteipulveratus flavus TaxID=3031728 RepID=A0ABT6C432_9MICO|nr:MULTISPECIES: DUF1232 domain-containing protein [unclassified Luteipulveratus]MDE9367796.1 DUF1232 domain-containing protein [Luteipulveratus sp. YIM 133132]MDF8263718.1 DUF1232 domain-containing protein [Luteipulveratus sp. YIM 133296]